MDDLPSPRELVRTHQTLKKLSHALFHDPEMKLGTPVEEIWGNLVEARRQVAIAMSYLGATDDRYRQAWERMLNLD